MIALETFMKDLLTARRCIQNEDESSMQVIGSSVVIVSDNARTVRVANDHYRGRHVLSSVNEDDGSITSATMDSSSSSSNLLTTNTKKSSLHQETRWQSSDSDLMDQEPHRAEQRAPWLEQIRSKKKKLNSHAAFVSKKLSTASNIMKRSRSDSALSLLDFSSMQSLSTTGGKAGRDHFNEFNSSESWSHDSSSTLSAPPRIPKRTVTPTQALTHLHLSCDGLPEETSMLNKTFDDDVDNDCKDDSNRIQIVRSALGKLAPHGQQASSSSQQEKTIVETRVAKIVCFNGEEGKDSLSRKMVPAVGLVCSKEAKSIFQLKIHQQPSLPEWIRGPPYDYRPCLLGQEEDDDDDIGDILKLLQ